MKSWRSILALLCAAAPTSALKNVVVLGSGDPWLSLCTAKTASARGLPATCVSNNEPEALKMLWGKGFDGASPVKVVNGPDAIGEALADCEGLVLNGAEFGGLTDRFAAIALELHDGVLLSRGVRSRRVGVFRVIAITHAPFAFRDSSSWRSRSLWHGVDHGGLQHRDCDILLVLCGW